MNKTRSHITTNESVAHKIIKRKAMKWLEEKGYTVYFEYWVKIATRLFRVDVVGFKGNKSIAIECGRTSYEKLQKLKTVFTDVKHFWYTSKVYPKMNKVKLDIIHNRKALSKLFQHGKAQVPRDIRKFLRVKDGDRLIWYDDNGRIFVVKAE